MVAQLEPGHPARGITVALRFADGAEQQLVTDAEGFALASGDATANAVGATMQAKASSGAVTVSAFDAVYANIRGAPVPGMQCRSDAA